MESDTVQIALIKSHAEARTREIVCEPKPTYDVEYEQITWMDYLAQLEQIEKWCDKKLAELEGKQNG